MPIEKVWQSFARTALPNVRESTTQYLEMRKAFISGMSVMLIDMEGGAVLDLDEDLFVACLERRKQELLAFFSAGGGVHDKPSK